LIIIKNALIKIKINNYIIKILRKKNQNIISLKNILLKYSLIPILIFYNEFKTLNKINIKKYIQKKKLTAKKNK
jgi:hypothetical protein